MDPRGCDATFLGEDVRQFLPIREGGEKDQRDLLFCNRVHLGVCDKMRLSVICCLLGHGVLVEVGEDTSLGIRLVHHGVDGRRRDLRLLFDSQEKFLLVGADQG